jgi:multidrug efflux system outer membrane protein
MNRLGAVIIWSGVVFGFVILSGCMLGPDYERPETAAVEGDRFIRTPAEWIDANDVVAIGRWWESFRDPVIGELVEEALANNTDLRAAAAGVVEAEALLDQSFGVRLADISYSANRTRTKMSFSLFGDRQSFYDKSYSQGLTINYIADFFGKLRRGERAALADVLAAEESQKALTHSIIAQVVRGRVQLAIQQRLLDVARGNIESWEQSLGVVERRYSEGLVGPVDVYLARENISAARALEPQIRQSLMLSQHSLDVLTGRRAGSSDVPADGLPRLPELGPVPMGLPVGLLDRRPDVRAAEMQLAAATERVGVSVAAMFPDLTLTGTGGYVSDNFRMMSATENEIYSAVIGLAAPVFKGGALKAQVEAAKARTEKAAANYVGVVLTALREVEDALVKHQTLSERIEQLQKRLGEAVQAEKLASDRYFQGVDRVLTVLETERRRRIAENELILAEGNLWNARIDLFLALGGDWKVVSGEEKDGTKQKYLAK